uniref:Uncharacterized protein n=1 Tax=Anopheles minimus TaxID=112268 RepID=A0A182W969_9DIPT
MQLTMMLKTILCDNWSITADEMTRRKGQENYSPAYRIVLDGRAADFRGFYRKDQYRSLFTAAANTLDSTNDRNELLVSLRAFMLAETQSASEKIARFTQELNEQLSNVRDRAEQDYLFLAQTFVPELLDRKSSEQQQGGTGTATSTASPSAEKTLQPLLTGLGTPVAATAADSHLETPPPTPECMPMSTGNSPPSMVNGSGTSVSPDQQCASGVSGGAGAHGFKPTAGNPRPMQLSSSAANTINNNTANSNQGAISKPPTQQPQQQQQHSMSTNLFANHGNTLGALTAVPGLAGSVGNLSGATHRFSGNVHQRPQQQQQQQTMFDSDCLFDIDGMENDNTPPPDDISDEEQSDYDDIPDNNNRADGGIFIPRHQYRRQTSAIAKSLPISMPKQMAPIKALAKSVHGEAVFGDLPRRQIQKFTSHI